MQSIQSKYSLSERLIRTIAAIRSFPHDNVEDLIRKVGPLILQCNMKEILILCAVTLILPSSTYASGSRCESDARHTEAPALCMHGC